MPASDPEQRARLLQAKLGALVAEHTGDAAGEPGGHADAATLRQGPVGWMLADGGAARALGPALAWARQQGIAEMHLLADDPAVAGTLARRAAAFTRPPTVWRVEGRTLAPAEPAPYPEPAAPPAGIDTMVELLHQAGLEVVVEHGAVTGEWRGLEVARIVEGHDGPRLEVGVGRHDREAFTLMHGEVPRPVALQAVVDAARRHRDAAAEVHPLGRLVPERWLRSLLVADPARVGAASLEPIEPVQVRSSVKDVMPAAAIGPAASGDGTVLVVASVGVDLDLVPEAADLRRREGTVGVRLVLVLPERDALPATRGLVEQLIEPAEIVTVPPDWRSLAS